MWFKFLEKRFPLPRASIIRRSYSAVRQPQKYRKDKIHVSYCYDRINEFKQNPDLNSIVRILDTIFYKSSININDSYLMNDLLEIISTVPIQHHAFVKEHLAELNGDKLTDILRQNISLQLLLSGNADHSQVYQFIVDNLHHNLNINLLEIFIYTLIKEENVSAATTLLHILLEKNPSFNISDELWSYYISKTCEVGHYLGSCLIYHELIDNHKVHSGEISSINFQNNYIPFLVGNSFIERLALIFQHNSDPMRINGLLTYFKRFYSYSGHAETYKSLKCSLVEAYSNEGNLGAALELFRTLAFVLKGHKNYKKNEGTTPKMSAFNHFRWRRDNIKTNNESISNIPDDMKTNLDFQEEATARGLNTILFRPNEERNVYTYPGHAYTPIVEGTLRLSDLPYFRSLIQANIQHLMNNSGPERLDSLMSYISGCHFMLHVFINASLCELGYIKEAFLLLAKLPKVYPKIYLNVLIREEDFIYLYKACKLKLNNPDTGSDYNNHFNEADEIYQLIYEIKLFQDNIDLKATVKIQSTKLNEIFISTLLSYRAITFEKIKFYLDELLRLSSTQNPVSIYLDEPEITKLKSLCSNESKYFTIIRTTD